MDLSTCADLSECRQASSTSASTGPVSRSATGADLRHDHRTAIEDLTYDLILKEIEPPAQAGPRRLLHDHAGSTTGDSSLIRHRTTGMVCAQAASLVRSGCSHHGKSWMYRCRSSREISGACHASTDVTLFSPLGDGVATGCLADALGSGAARRARNARARLVHAAARTRVCKRWLRGPGHIRLIRIRRLQHAARAARL